MYLGVAVVIGRWCVDIGHFGAIALLIYIKAFEEKEMISRFGNDYLEYKEQTPFLIPFRKTKEITDTIFS